jgi:hypothetical protein
MLLFTLVSRIVLSVVVGLLGGFIWWMLDRRENWKTTLVILLVGASTFGSLAGLEIIPSSPVDVRITSPSSGTIVGKAEISVAGTVSPPDARVLVLVHPVDSNRWWVQLEPSISQQNFNQTASQWETTIYLGDETHGIGEQFEVVALGSGAALAFDILTGRYYPTGAEVDALPPLSRSNVVSLCRECQDTP